MTAGAAKRLVHGHPIGDDDPPVPQSLLTQETKPVPRTDSRKANQRRRFQKQRQESRKRVKELKAAPKPEAST